MTAEEPVQILPPFSQNIRSNNGMRTLRPTRKQLGNEDGILLLLKWGSLGEEFAEPFQADLEGSTPAFLRTSFLTLQGLVIL